ncbi:MAG: hypothetical protein HYT98_03830 [Candidatus Sungbacteria bacterium]|nr:hypothetical protein [Candidatus Sungbacteria bacterium]
MSSAQKFAGLKIVKPLSGLLIFSLLLPSLFIPLSILVVPNPVVAAVSVARLPLTCLIDFGCIKETIGDTLIKAASNAILRAMTNSVVSWIQGGGGNFVQNLEQELGRQLDLRLGEFLNRLAGINLCGGIGAQLGITLSLGLGGGRLSQKLGCTLSGIVNNVQNFFLNFANGGWPAFFHIGLNPMNNYYGQYFIARDELILNQIGLAESINKNFLAGKGFLGIQECEQVPDGDMDLEGNATYYSRCKTTTPGATVARALEKAAVDTPFEQLVNVHEIQEMVNAILNALIQKVMTGIF